MISDDILNHPVIKSMKVFGTNIIGMKYIPSNETPIYSGVYVIILSNTKKVYVGYSVNVDKRIKTIIKSLKKGTFDNIDFQNSYDNNYSVELLLFPTIYKHFAICIRGILRESLGDIVGVSNFGRECESPKRFNNRW